MSEQQRNAADHESDPAHTDDTGMGWTDEGGATPTGPSTHESSGHAEHHDGAASGAADDAAE